MENGDLSRLGWDLGADDGNLKTLSALLDFVQDGLSGAAPDVFEFRDGELRNAMDAAIADGTIPAHFHERFHAVVQTVDALHTERCFAAAAAAFGQSPDELPHETRSSLIDAALRAGAATPEIARAICTAVLSAARVG